MMRTWLLAGVTLAWLTLAGCTVQPVTPLPPPGNPAAATPPPPPAAEATTAAPPAETTPTPAEHAGQEARNLIAQQTQLDHDQITIVAVEEVEWPDACLGVYGPEEMCAAVITPGFRVVVDTPNGEYVVHTDAEARSLRIASAPEAAVGDVLVEWQQTDETCQSAVIGRAGVAYGACGGLQLPGKLAGPERAVELEEFVATYAPFEADTPAGTVVFHGAGAKSAFLEERRMIAEWARLVAQEAEAGRGGASWGLVFAWHRQGGIMGHCDDLTVYVTGQAYAASCRKDPPATIAQRRLTTDELVKVYRWVDTLAAWEYREGDLMPADGMLTTMVFSGAGDATAQASDKQIAVSFAQNLWANMTQ